MPAGKKSAGQRKPSQKQRRLKQKASARGHGVYVAETKAVTSEASDNVHWRPEVCDAVKFERDDDEDETLFKDVKLEYDDIEEDDDDDQVPETLQNVFGAMPNDNDNEDWMTQLSHNMATFLRHNAYNEDLLGEDGWVPLCDALPRLHCTAAEVAKAVQLSDRYDDEWGLGARFEMYISGSRTWIRATDGAYYRQRSRRSQRSSTAR